MPSINDLKNDGKVKIPFIPGLVQEDTVESDNNGNFIPSIQVGESTPATENVVRKKPAAVSMTSAKTREKADFSTIPEAKVEGVNFEQAPDQSLKEKILGPGGAFEEYFNNMKNNAKEFYAEEALEEELNEEKEKEIAEEATKKAKRDVSNDELDTEDIENEYKSNNTVNYKTINVLEEEPSTEDDMSDIIKDEISDDEINTTENVDIDESEEEINTTEDIVEPDEEVKVSVVDYEVEEKEKVEDEIEVKREIIKNEVSDNEDDDLDDSEVEAEEEDITEEDANRYLEIIRAEVTKRIKPVSKKLDISSFTVVKKPTLNNTILEPKEVPVAKWALPATGITYQIKEILGSDIERIRAAVNNKQMSTVLQIVYDHIVSPKPDTLEAWAKTIAFDDFDHLFMGIYIASFADSNYIQMVCDNTDCKDKVFITDNIPIMDMVKFKDDEAEKKFKALLSSDAVNPHGLYTTEIVPISEKFAFSFIIPSIYTIYIEDGYIDDAFRTKYANATSIAPYIDNIYLIDQENRQLTPIGYKDYPNNKAKTIKSKIVKYDKVISTLDMDEINLIRAYMAKIMEADDTVSYVVPAATCPHCGKELDEAPSSALQLVFSRNQLSLLVNI